MRKCLTLLPCIEVALKVKGKGLRGESVSRESACKHLLFSSLGAACSMSAFTPFATAKRTRFYIGPWAMKRREQVQRNCQCASTSRQKTHQAKADRAPRFRQCLIIARRSSTCRVELHWHLGPGADHGRMARIAEAWDRSTAPGATSRSTISSASIRLQRLRLACRSGAQLIPILATRYGWARPGHACLWTDIVNPL